MIPISKTQLGLVLVVVLAVGLIAGAGGMVAFVHLLDDMSAGEAMEPAATTDMGDMAGMDHSGHDMSSPAASGSMERTVAYWYDPMHPSYRSDKPGIAPDCGMQLVPRYQDELDAMAEMAPGTVRVSAEKQQLIGIRTTTAQRVHLTRTLRTVGRIEADETRLSRVHTRVEGWVEEVYGDFVGSLVRKGQPLFTLYSPDLVSTQEEYLLARRGGKTLANSPYANVAEGSDALLRAARERLRLWEISEEQIERLERTGEVQRTLTIVAPVTGFVTERNVYPQTYVKPDMPLYRIADLSEVWVRADLYEFEAPLVRPGQSATMRLSHAPGREYRGRVEYIYPTVNADTRTVQVRLTFRNPGLELKPDMFADVDLPVDYGRHVVVPSEAVLDTGKRRIVFVDRGEGRFEPREVSVGPRFDGKAAILTGIEAGERVVASGNFLIDSESKLTSTAPVAAHDH